LGLVDAHTYIQILVSAKVTQSDQTATFLNRKLNSHLSLRILSPEICKQKLMGELLKD